MKSWIMGMAIMTASAFISSQSIAEQVIGPAEYSASEVRVDNFVGTINVKISAGGTVGVKIQGDEKHMDDIEVFVSGDQLVIRRDVDFRDWAGGIFGKWSGEMTDQLDRLPVAEISVPKGTSLKLDDIAGKLDVGDLNGPLELSGWWLNGTIGDVTEAEISVLGSGDIKLGNVAGRLDLEVRGSGDVEALSVGSADLESAGSGAILIGKVARSLEYDGLGSGDGTFGSVNGAVSVSILGSGDVDIHEGIADPLDVSIMGSADFTFGGTAHHSHVLHMGSGNIRIADDNRDNQ